MRRFWTGAALLSATLGLSACGGAAEPAANAAAKPHCRGAALASWQRLADRIHARVYCPAWMPDPLDGVIGSRWNNIDGVSGDRSYLESWVWQETGAGAAGGELHVNLRGYPGRAGVPRCRDADTEASVPCFADPHGTKRFGTITATLFTSNRDADQWHVAYGWRSGGSFYTLSEHVAPPLTYPKVVSYLNRMMSSLQPVEPKS